jgi:Protein of unknown function (DUF2630)
MEDQQVFGHIEQLAEEEHELLRRAAHGRLDEQERERLHTIEVQLDQYWDLLRQRRARREAGLDPDDAQPRGESTVEGYQQ